MSLIQDLRYSLRRLVKSPGFTTTAVLTLALGMGATTAMYSVIHAVLLNSLPFAHPEQLMVFRESQKSGEMSVTWPNFEDWRAQQHSFEGLAAFDLRHYDYFDGTRTTLTRGAQVTSEFFPVLGVKPESGRVFGVSEDRPGATPVVVLGHKFWQNELHADPAAIGKAIELSGRVYTVIGVMPAGFHFFFGRSEDFYVPLGPEAADPSFNNRTAHGSISVLARPKPGISAAAAQTELVGIAARLAAEYPATNAGHTVVARKLVDQYFAEIRPVLWLLMAAVAIVLLVGCANVSNLLLTRGADREREFAIRSALGASKYRIFQQSLGESIWLALLAGACGVAIAYFSLPFLLRVGPSNIPRLGETSIQWPILGFAFVVALCVSLICGMLPGWATLRVAPEQALRSHSTSSYAGRGRQRVRSALLVGGVAITLLLAAASGLLVQSLRRTLAVNPGFQPGHLLALDIILSGDKYKSKESSLAFFSAAEEKLLALPGVTEVGNICTPPLAGECGDYFYSIPGRTDANDANLPDANFNIADENYFRTAGIRLISGRPFLPTDSDSSPHVAVINQAFARKWWPAGDAVGHTVHFGGRGEPGDMLQIVGVVENTKQYGLDSQIDPEIFFPEKQHQQNAMVLMVRTAGNPESLAATAENAIQSVDKEVPVRIHPMSYYVAQSLRQRQFLTLLLSIFAGLAIFLAALGVFGVAAYAVASRKGEIAVRLALGAPPQNVKAWITMQTMRRVAFGCAIGLVGASLGARVVRNFLYDVSPTDPLVLSATCALLIGVALLATWIPARRAAAIDPMRTLRAE
jgi:putative ABC transport system permease protein